MSLQIKIQGRCAHPWLNVAAHAVSILLQLCIIITTTTTTTIIIVINFAWLC
jgi:hypothetical protein